MQKVLIVRVVSLAALVLLGLLLVLPNSIGRASTPTMFQKLYPGPTQVAGLPLAPGPPSSSYPGATVHTKSEGVPALTLPITEASIRAYLVHDEPGSGAKIQDPATAEISYITVGKLRTILKNEYALSDFDADESIIYVVSHAPSVIEDVDGKPITIHFSYVVFNASTGNRLMSGTGRAGD